MTWRARVTQRAPHVVVVGDALLDVDLLGQATRICPDAPVPVVDVDGRRESPGGAGLTTLLCADAGADVTLVCPLADDEEGARLADALRARVRLVPLPHEGATRTKTRVRCHDQTLLRLDHGGPGRPLGQPDDVVRDALAAADVVLVSDYGAGTTAHAGIRQALQDSASHRRVVWDPHPRGGAPVPGSTVVTPNLAEAKAAVAALGGDPARPPEELAEALREAWSVGACCVTAGSSGAFLATGSGEPLFVPAPVVAVGDPCGAGDRFAATIATALAGGEVLSEVVVDAVHDASAWVAAGGAAAYRSSAAQATTAESATGDAADVIARVRGSGGRVVATGGCFDVLHAGHVASLQAARRLGDALVVLLNSDASVRRAKGPGRPVVPAGDRAKVLLGLGCVDAVEVFDADDPSDALERLRPDIWAKGGDYGGTPLPEADVIRRHGGRVVLLPYLDGRSSSRILASVATRPDPEHQEAR